MSLEIIQFINANKAGMAEHFMRKDHRSMYELWEGILNFVEKTGPIEPLEFYERYEDMSRTGRLQVFIESDGDIIVTAIPDTDGICNTPASVQFCTVGSGGGKSPNVRAALLGLIRAIKKDNQDNPINR